ncbi:unnamed protein product [Vitrella brassicaformis CCMP3155]|uniref:Uncharacterized protein n=1 Tax=Vitrella brassicaformis (strain CCMP3155) TaxID=1169540 RepID=A0A0G4FU00_VITBC|nr:unnamed protein product [Vitrella brassicaformis CCMP3155]|eukprot:CEM18438.1 unnamed protein product [Vitrella brassicaformis CCMP3155]
MQPTGAAPLSQPLFQPAELFDLSLPISKMAAMAMATDDATRAALPSQIVTPTRQQELLGHTSATVTSTLLNGAQRHIDKAIRRLDLEDVLAFDIDGNVEGGLRVVWLLEQGSGEEWRAMGRFLRVAFIYRLTPNATRPLQMSADSLPTATAFHQLLLTMAIYSTVGRQLTYGGTSLALQQADDGAYRIGNVSFRVVSHGDLPGGHRYADGYKRTDPTNRWGSDLFPSFSAYLLTRLFWQCCYEEGVGQRRVLRADIGRGDPRYGRLLTEGITEDQGIAVDWRYDGGHLNAANPSDCRLVIVSGFRRNETLAAYLWVGSGRIDLYTTEPSAADAPAPIAQRFPESVGAVRRVLRAFGLERDVIDRGTVDV